MRGVCVCVRQAGSLPEEGTTWATIRGVKVGHRDPEPEVKRWLIKVMKKDQGDEKMRRSASGARETTWPG